MHKYILILQLFLDYMAETYSKFMHGEDVFEDEDEAFLTKLSKHSSSQSFKLECNSKTLFWCENKKMRTRVFPHRATLQR